MSPEAEQMMKLEEETRQQLALQEEERFVGTELFLAAHPDFEEIGRKESVPFASGCDGAFACALCRR